MGSMVSKINENTAGIAARTKGKIDPWAILLARPALTVVEPVFSASRKRLGMTEKGL